MVAASFDEYPDVVLVDGKAYRVDGPLPEGVEEGVYESGWAMVPGGWDANCYEFCARCTAARNPKSGREACMNAREAETHLIVVRRENFFSPPAA